MTPPREPRTQVRKPRLLQVRSSRQVHVQRHPDASARMNAAALSNVRPRYGDGLERSEMPRVIEFAHASAPPGCVPARVPAQWIEPNHTVATSLPEQFNHRVNNTLVLSPAELQLVTMGTGGLGE